MRWVDASCVKKDGQRPRTPYEHAWKIREQYGSRPFDDPVRAQEVHASPRRTGVEHSEGPVALFEPATGWLRRNRVLLPGVTVLTRQVAAAAREAAEARLYAARAAAARNVDLRLPQRLADLLQVPDGSRLSAAGHHPRSPNTWPVSTTTRPCSDRS